MGHIHAQRVAFTKFRVTFDGPMPTVELNGETVTAPLSAIAFQHRPGEPPRLALEVAGDGIVEGEGVVTVGPACDHDDRDAVVAFLANIDAEQLNTAVMERMGWGSGSTMAVALEVLRDMAAGQ